MLTKEQQEKIIDKLSKFIEYLDEQQDAMYKMKMYCENFQKFIDNN